ncbi:ankyrin repeat domain-containing protein [Brachyspira pilosicoli]|uniref:Ankyrin repeat domain-containing protein n=1 Tax=Brachyspira pilosicoli TaxID=52584 RepID=A0AAJ6GDL3_BRAPL|nr:ankyrin repeat domain-containing protein [Brachyspira pilosicoli]WIH90459.1 ankyrin repeat domain-containing protein [Brachyspira pilosicoli]WIH92750.1 ankyrin repeat domain-containing protein [Brachyspira pilosicoli]WIH95039.1 ankyrin repeat domain-containing protein [Brachyspira pilosicoli]
MKKKILFILIIAISLLYSKSNNDKINSLAITNEIIKPSDELLILLEKNKKKTGVAEIIELINEGGINASSKTEINIGDVTHYANSTPLMIASSYGHYDIAKALIDNGALVNLRAGDGFNALMEAVRTGNIEIAKLLIEHNSDINIKNKDGKNMIMIACEKGNEEMFNLLIENNADINEKSSWGASALIYASEKGNINIMKYLIDNGIDVNGKADDNGDTPLLWAVTGDNPYESSKLLIENGANVNATNYGGVAPATILAASTPKVVKLLKDNGADLDTKFLDYYPPIAIAAGAGNLEIVKALVENGADVNYYPNDINYTAIFHAIDQHNYEVAEYLFKNGVDLNIKMKPDNDYGRSIKESYNVLEYAEAIQDKKMIDLVKKYYKKK